MAKNTINKEFDFWLCLILMSKTRNARRKRDKYFQRGATYPLRFSHQYWKTACSTRIKTCIQTWLLFVLLQGLGMGLPVAKYTLYLLKTTQTQERTWLPIQSNTLWEKHQCWYRLTMLHPREKKLRLWLIRKLYPREKLVNTEYQIRWLCVIRIMQEVALMTTL